MFSGPPDHIHDLLLKTLKRSAGKKRLDGPRCRKNTNGSKSTQRNVIFRARPLIDFFCCRLLDSARSQNIRTKILLQTAARTIRQYDDLKGLLAKTLGVSHGGLAPNFLDALGHDPASITGDTHSQTGWRAVEEVELRISRQSAIFNTFLVSFPTFEVSEFTDAFSTCDERMIALSHAIEELTKQYNEVQGRIPEVHKIAEHVTELRGQLKAAYDLTERHTSSNYPEVRFFRGLMPFLFVI